MSVMPEADEAGRASPVEPGTPIGGWVAGARIAIRGDVHVHRTAPPDEVHLAVWRYRGAEPLPRFLELLRRDAEQWGSFHGEDGRLTAVVPTLDIARIPGQMVFYWAQEAPQGISLAERIDATATTQLAPGFALEVARQIGAALSEIHDRGLIHGDLDPHNVYLAGAMDFVRLAWGGLATRLELAGADAGRGSARTLAEVAPEVLLGKAPDARSDLYSLCALTFRMLAGQPPWLVRRNGPLPGVTDSDSLPPMPEWVVSPLPELLAIGLQRDPARRPDSVADWCDRLAQVAAEIDELPAPPGTWAPPLEDGIEPTPPTVHRTLSPIERLLAPDPALSNTPGLGIGASSYGTTPYPAHAPPTPLPSMRSVAPALPRVAAGPPLEASTPMSLPPSTVLPAPEARIPPKAGPPTLAPFALGFMMIVGFTAVLSAILCGMPWRTEQVPVQVPTIVVAPSPAPRALSAPAEPAVLAVPVFRLLSEPIAEVWEDGERIGFTPRDIPLTGTADDPPRRFELRAQGHKRRVFELPWSDRPGEQLVVLDPITTAPGQRPSAEGSDPQGELPPLKPTR